MLYKHQIEALEKTEYRNRVAYYLDMGLGKTFVGAEKMSRLGATVNLIVCQKSKIQDWMKHFEDYYAFARLYDLTKKKDYEKFIFDVNQKPMCPMIGVINYELAWRRDELLKLKNFTLMLDESSLIQNRTVKKTKFILKLKSENVILLSGTPCSGKYENLWTQAKLLGWDIPVRMYEDHYVNYVKLKVGGQTIRVVDKKNPYKNIERLKSKLRDYGAVFMKTEEVMELPQQNIIDVNVDVSNDYRKFMKHSIVDHQGEILVGDTSLTKRLQARKLCGMYSENKLIAFKDLLESTNDRLIVFYSFKRELEELREITTKLHKSISVVNGATKDLEAYNNEDDSVTFVQYQAGAKGLNLQMANKVIYFSPTESCENYMQSMKRIHRIGQNRPCYYYRMICGIEKDIYKALERGEDYTDELFRRNYEK